jgi:hypothetical protein
MPEVNTDQRKDMSRACGCGPAMREMAATCCREPEGTRAGSDEQQATASDEGGA